ncbi:MAG: hypothetical protein JWM68_149, partial [Verrucomicrobiales bacterium]|nr:hypothetical protein [Verrucomicrobiales bacterium]
HQPPIHRTPALQGRQAQAEQQDEGDGSGGIVPQDPRKPGRSGNRSGRMEGLGFIHNGLGVDLNWVCVWVVVVTGNGNEKPRPH